MENLSTTEPTIIMEERIESMVSVVGSEISTLRKAHFLKPSSSSAANNLVTKTLPSPPRLSSKMISGKVPFQVESNGRRYRQNRWNEWVGLMQPRYQDIWKKAGIFDAIVASTYKISKVDNDLIFRLAEKWCEVTNTFIFPWGETTITLEDMMVLGGFSVLGESVDLTINHVTDFAGKLNRLNKVYIDMIQSGRKVSEKKWVDRFLGTKDPLEHEAFLSYWLSCYVLPKTYGYVGRQHFPLAIHISNGIHFALAPAVLASIYRDLSLLKKSLVAENSDKLTTVMLWGPFQLVQLWVWERFPSLGYTPNALKAEEPRAARWHNLNVNMTKELEFSDESDFRWRPYTTDLENWDHRKFYSNDESCVLRESNEDLKVESLARCLRDSELVGIDCVEHYFPHRVARQFGFDQDVPVNVFKPNQPAKSAWENYTKPIKYSGFYIPPRLTRSAVTENYSKWLKNYLHVDQTTSEISSPSAILANGGKKDEIDFEKIMAMMMEDDDEDNVDENALMCWIQEFQNLIW